MKKDDIMSGIADLAAKGAGAVAGMDPTKAVISFDGNGAKGLGAISQILKKSEATALRNNGFNRPGYVFRGWNTKKDGSGTKYDNRSSIVCKANAMTLYAMWEPEMYHKSITASQVLHMIPSQNPKLFVSAQGFCMAKKGKARYAACCFIRNTPEYKAGNDKDYNSSVVLYNMETGKMVAHVDKLPLDHANGMCYDPKKQRFYIVTLGNAKKPGTIYELDWNMKVTNKILPKNAAHIGAIAYYNGIYTGLLPVGHGKYTFVDLDANWNVLRQTKVITGYDADFISQGICVDGKYIYNVACDFNDSDWSKHQRINVYDKATGKRVGMQNIVIPHEIEDLDILDGRLYLNTNRQTACDIYIADKGSIKLYV